MSGWPLFWQSFALTVKTWQFCQRSTKSQVKKGEYFYLLSPYFNIQKKLTLFITVNWTESKGFNECNYKTVETFQENPYDIWRDWDRNGDYM